MRRSSLLLLPLLAACAPAAAPAPSAPAPTPGPEVAVPAPALEPSAAALRVADRLEPTGLELGTMWTFENPPLEYWQREYGFTATDEWLEQLRLSTVRYANYCTGSFVSGQGLVMTNHHCARECVASSSSGAIDFVEEGFYARRPEDEIICEGLYLDQLIEIEDVTERVRQAGARGASDTAAARLRADEITVVEAECNAQGELVCQVVTLFRGGQHQIYKYRRYPTVKLVFAPELQAGFFGGDPDNFEFPRYVLDVAFVRAYEEDASTPLATPHHFRFDPEGADVGELTFTIGNPGSTSRLATVAQVMYEKEYRHPFLIWLLGAQRDFLQEIARMSPEMERAVREDLFSIENSLKSFEGHQAGLEDSLVIGAKLTWERDFRARIERDATLRDRYGDIWQRIAELQRGKLELSPLLNASDVQFSGFAAPHLTVAGLLADYVSEMAKPEAERDPDFVANRPQVEQQLFGPLPVNPEISVRLLANQLEVIRRWLPESHDLRRLAFRAGETPDAAAARLIRDTRIGDAGYRQQLARGGPTALAATPDPLVQLAARMVEIHEPTQARWVEIQAAEDAQEGRLAEALFAAYGKLLPPEATLTLRISDGRVLGYVLDGDTVPAWTTFAGMFERAERFGGAMPYTLPDDFAQDRADIDMATPFNLVTTNDVSGGSSGSPMIDREGRVVGIVFDSNFQGLRWEFLFGGPTGRTIAVHSAGIIEGLRAVYEADRVVDELLGGR